MAIRLRRKCAMGDRRLLTAQWQQPSVTSSGTELAHCQQIEGLEGNRELKQLVGPAGNLPASSEACRCWMDDLDTWISSRLMWINAGRVDYAAGSAPSPHPEPLAGCTDSRKPMDVQEAIWPTGSTLQRFTIQACSRPTRSPRSARRCGLRTGIAFWLFNASDTGFEQWIVWPGLRTGMSASAGHPRIHFASSARQLGCRLLRQTRPTGPSWVEQQLDDALKRFAYNSSKVLL